MDEKALFLKFWKKEAPATRKVISRIPQERSDYRPDPKARNAREIAWLIVREEIILVEGLEKGVLEWVEVPTPATIKEIVDTYDRHHEDLTAKLERIDASRWDERVPLHVRRPGNHERDRERKRLGLPAGHDSSPRTALHVPAPDGFNRAGDLRPKR